ncbi:PAS domain-containing sensor histidine kinase [Natrinema halophilum]|uniref:histidine kinase n=1 Tax=Natrinema halophilum TaxID=1699371 RepID=A0A7D5KSX7_9EURY|nr:PAS domain S-box protein [Natrinema halophilum]QLG50837.1 PAS domain S-box protein [Natrinema halophilum]
MSDRVGDTDLELLAGAGDSDAHRRCRALLSAIDDGIAIADTDGDLTDVNERAEDILGRPREALVGSSSDDSRWHLLDRNGERLEANDTPFDRIFERKKPIYDQTIGLRRPSGERVWLSVNGAPRWTGNDEFDGAVFVFEDVTGKRDVDIELEEILGRITDGFYALDEEFRFTHVNERAEELLESTEDELLGENLWEQFPEAAEIDVVRHAFDSAMETQESQSYELYYAPLDFWVKATIYPSRTGVSAYFRDVTERKEREFEREGMFRDLQESEERLRLALEAGEMGTWELDLETEESPVRSPEHDRIFGYEEPREDWSFEAFLDHVHPDDRENVERSFEDAFETGTWDVECRIIRADGEQRTIAARGEFHFDGEEDPVRTVGVVRDVTERTERERYLEEAKAQLEAATEAGAVSTWEWHIPENSFVTGASFARTFDIDPDAARNGVPIERLLTSIHEDDRTRVEDQIEAALETCGEYESEYRVWNANDEPRWVIARGHVECDDDGNAERFPGALTDITERKRAELELEKQSRELETLFRVLPVGVVVANADGSLRRANDTAREIWGGDVFDAESVEEYEKYSAVWADSGDLVGPRDWTMAQVLEGEEVTDPNVYQIETFDDERRIIMEHGMPVRDGRGDVSRAVVTLTDITERRDYEQALEERERQLSTLMENVPGMVYRCRNERGWPMEFVSDACREITGYTSEALETGEVSYGDDIMLEADRDEVWEDVQQPTGDRDTYSLSYRIETDDGERKWVRSYGRRLFDDDETVVALEGILSDISERKRLETELKESNRRLEQFAYAASHDLQEPLRMITSYLQLLETRYGDTFDEDGQEFLDYAVDGAERMREMIDALLTYSRVDTRGDPFEPVDLDAVLDDVREDLQMRIDESDAYISSGSLPRVAGDVSQLRQVFQNLLRNAIEYSGDEPPRIDVTAERDGTDWIVSVRDEGVGIDSDDTDRIFEVFQRLHTHEEHPGTGIGLALCRRIVDRHGGEIWVDTEPGDGATFSFTLPADT